MTIININENYGDPISFRDKQEMADAIVACGYKLPEDGLKEGRDYCVEMGEHDVVCDACGAVIEGGASVIIIYGEAYCLKCVGNMEIIMQKCKDKKIID